VADTEHAFGEAGEFRRALEAGALPEAKRAALSQLVSGTVKVPGEGLITFKSVGSALQDLALAGRYYELLKTSGVPTAPDLAQGRQPANEKSRGPREHAAASGRTSRLRTR